MINDTTQDILQEAQKEYSADLRQQQIDQQKYLESLDCVEIKVYSKTLNKHVTLTTLKMNPYRRSLVCKKMLSKLLPDAGEEKSACKMADNIGDSYSVLSSLIWDFLDPVTKADFTFKEFEEGLDDHTSMIFYHWATAKFNQVQRFFPQSSAEKTHQ